MSPMVASRAHTKVSYSPELAYAGRTHTGMEEVEHNECNAVPEPDASSG